MELALEYEVMFHADVADCYGTIYTHSIAWALHGKDEAKRRRGDMGLLGNAVDHAIQDMRRGQTNGIPQGPVLMDLVAELVLGYADSMLEDRLGAWKEPYLVLRYRDDYRVYAETARDGEVVLKALTEVLIELGLRLNPRKTAGPLRVVAHSVKEDKLAWLRARQWDRDPQKHLLLIHAHGAEHPNSGSLVRALGTFYRRLNAPRGTRAPIRAPIALASIATDIAFGSPRALPLCAGIISKALDAVGCDRDRATLARQVRAKLARVPNAGLMEVWLQRVTLPYLPDLPYEEKLCRLVAGEEVRLWDSEWVEDRKLRRTVDACGVVDRAKLRRQRPVVAEREVALFPQAGY